VPTLLQATGGLQRVRELLGEQPAIVEPPDARRLPQLTSGISFEDVTFGYTDGHKNLSGVSMDLQKGARIAFVGHSGCVKSTNLNLIMRFYDPQAGRVLFDGIDLREAVLDSALRAGRHRLSGKLSLQHERARERTPRQARRDGCGGLGGGTGG
jgi:ABC-type multidrug transport system fused ATPase/permease subunit